MFISELSLLSLLDKKRYSKSRTLCPHSKQRSAFISTCIEASRFEQAWAAEGNPPKARLFYRRNGRTSLEVKPPASRFPTLTASYDDPTLGSLICLTKFYQQVTRSYISINKIVSDSFLQRESGDRQATMPFKKGCLLKAGGIDQAECRMGDGLYLYAAS